jgi:hypothetical protein
MFDAGSAAAPSAMSGCGPVAWLLEAARPATIDCAIASVSLSAGGAAREGGSGAEALKTEKAGASSSTSACARVPSSQLWSCGERLAAGGKCGYGCAMRERVR